MVVEVALVAVFAFYGAHRLGRKAGKAISRSLRAVRTDAVYVCGRCGEDVTAQAFRKATGGWRGGAPTPPYVVDIVVVCSAGHYSEMPVTVAESVG